MRIKRAIQFYAILLFLLGTTYQKSDARHIIGGDVTYECLGLEMINGVQFINLMIEFNMYRDSQGGGAGFDGAPGSVTQGRFGIFTGSGNSWTFLSEEDNFVPLLVEEVVIQEPNPCIIYPTNVGVERGLYRFPLQLEVIDQSYMIVYQRCCRNESIDNIVDPGSTGAAYSIEITPMAQSICNDSPKFNNFPPVVICSNFEVDFDHSASDAQGHQIVYEFCAPLASGGTDGATTPGDPLSCTGVIPAALNCAPPYDVVEYELPFYSANIPMGGNPIVSIHPTTGLISGIPTINGQFVVGVCASEFLNGNLLSVLRRDFQFNVTNCDPVVYASIAHDSVVQDALGVERFVLSSCGENVVEFINESTDEQFIDEYQWVFDINGVDEIYNSRDIEVTFPGVGRYDAEMILNPGTVCSDTSMISVNIFPAVEADFGYQYDTCVAGEVSFEDMSSTGATSLESWSWNFNDQGISNDQDPKFLFPTPGTKEISLSVRDNNRCEDVSIQNIEWLPAPDVIIVQPNNHIGCAPAEIKFNNLSSPIDDTYLIEWDFGDGGMSGEISPTHVYEEVGKYSISLTITSPIGCTIEDYFADRIEIQPSPTADFTFTPDNPSVFQPEVDFFDLSENTSSWQWTFGDTGFSIFQSPSHTYQDSGVFDIQLVAFHPSGCTDTIVKRIDIEPIVSFHMPNAFTPNGDATNDILIGNGFLDGMVDFKYAVWNRWGEQIFESLDPRVGWNGTKNNVGNPAPSGVYVYTISYISPRGVKEELRGHATLIR